MKRRVGRQDNALVGSSGKTRVTRFLYRPPPALALAFRTLRIVRFISNNVCVKKLPKTRLGQATRLLSFLLLLLLSLSRSAFSYDEHTRIEANNGEKISLPGPESFGNFHRKSFSWRRTRPRTRILCNGRENDEKSSCRRALTSSRSVARPPLEREPFSSNEIPRIGGGDRTKGRLAKLSAREEETEIRVVTSLMKRYVTAKKEGMDEGLLVARLRQRGILRKKRGDKN